MTIEEFESGARETLEQALNQLHAANLLVAQLETQILDMGQSTQAISRRIETFVAAQRQRDRPAP